MSVTQTAPTDNLLLARLTAAKLAKVMHGILSVGTACLETKSLEQFLNGREKLPLALIEVLRSSVGKPDDPKQFENEMDRMADLVQRFHSHFAGLSQWREMAPAELRAAFSRLGDCYAEFCNLLGAIGTRLGMDLKLAEQATKDRDYLEAFFKSLPVA
jgi:hypothetical protein